MGFDFDKCYDKCVSECRSDPDICSEECYASCVEEECRYIECRDVDDVESCVRECVEAEEEEEDLEWVLA